MIGKILLFSLKSIFRYRVNTLINSVGMTLGIVAAVVLLSYTYYETKIGGEFDNKNVYRIELNTTSGILSNTPYPLVSYIKDNVPTVKNITYFAALKEQINFTIHDDFYKINNILVTDTSFFNFYPCTILLGDINAYQTTPNSIVLTLSESKRLFGNDNPIGQQVVTMYGSIFNVVAVIQDFSSNFLLEKFKLFINSHKGGSIQFNDNWGSFDGITLLEFYENQKQKDLFLDEINMIMQQRLPEMKEDKGIYPVLKEYKSIYLTASTKWEILKKGNSKFLLFFITTSLFLFIISFVNSVSLIKIQWLNRLKEFNIRKIYGARNVSIISMLTIEVLVLALIDFILFILSIYITPIFLKELKTILWFVYSIEFIFIVFLLFLFFNVCIGLFVAGWLVKINLINGLKSKEAISNVDYHLLTKALMVTQFSICIAMISFAIGIRNQISFIANKNIGFSYDNVILIDVTNFFGYDILKNELLKHPEITDVAFSQVAGVDYLMGEDYVNINCGGKSRKGVIANYMADSEYVKLMGFRLIKGNDFYRNSTKPTFIVNETFAKTFGVDNIDNAPMINNLIIIGIIEEYNFRSLHNKIEPLAIGYNPKCKSYRYCIVKYSSSRNGETERVISHMKKSWKKIAGEIPIEITIMEQSIHNLYSKENQFRNTITVFTFFITFICLMGVFGISLNFVYKRTKEIGVRRVNGASIFRITKMLVLHFLKLVVVSNIIAVPISFYALTRWLENFEYRTSINWLIFGMAGIIIILLVVITTLFQSFKAASKNPVETLKYE